MDSAYREKSGVQYRNEREKKQSSKMYTVPYAGSFTTLCFVSLSYMVILSPSIDGRQTGMVCP